MKKKGLNLNNALYKEKSREIKRNIRKDKKDYIEAQCKEMEKLHRDNKDRQLLK